MKNLTFMDGLLHRHLLALMAWLCLGGPGLVQAQWTVQNANERVHAGDVVNLFVQWEGRERCDGLVVALPTGWTLEEVTVTQRGRRSVPVLRRQEPDNGEVVTLTQPLSGAHTFILRVAVAGAPGQRTWSLTPLVRTTNRQGKAVLERREGLRLDRTARVEAEALPSTNQLLAFDGTEPVLLRASALPDLGLQDSYTVEFWMKTTGLNEVLLSAWTGREDEAYPLELMVNAEGRLLYYRGQPGQHEGMITPYPVADGSWHHLALTHDGASGWTRLLVDGVTVDSLARTLRAATDLRTTLAVGGRVPQAGVARVRGYSGALDEVRFWPSARPAATLRQSMRQPMRSQGALVVLSFDEALPPALLERRPQRVRRVASDLEFYTPLRNLRVAREGAAILLTWEARERQTAAFVVERATDGRTFTPVGRVEAREATPLGTDGTQTFHFRDPAAPDQVVYYRIRQRFESGIERVSAPLKIGADAGPPEATTQLLGNFPNPFTTTTLLTYSVAEAQHIRLSVWNLEGHQVALLVDQVQAPGTYQVPFQADDLPSGPYFVRLYTAAGVLSRQIVRTR
jgi:hypothetical protein